MEWYSAQRHQSSPDSEAPIEWSVMVEGSSDCASLNEILADLSLRRRAPIPSSQLPDGQTPSTTVHEDHLLDPREIHAFWLNRRGVQLLLTAISGATSLIPTLDQTDYEEVTASEARLRLWPYVESMKSFLMRAAEPLLNWDPDFPTTPAHPAVPSPAETVGIDPHTRKNTNEDWVPWQIALGNDSKRGTKRFAQAALRHPSVKSARVLDSRNYFWMLIPAPVVQITLVMFGSISVVMADLERGLEDLRAWEPDGARSFLEQALAADLADFLVQGERFPIERSDPRTTIPMGDGG
jgi:hypothetical protein